MRKAECMQEIGRSRPGSRQKQVRSEQEAGMMEVWRQAGGMYKTGWRHAEGGQEAERSREEVSRRQA
jgi:hypothetical protein